jgi:DNA-binding beta-propeller fold protein YncE
MHARRTRRPLIAALWLPGALLLALASPVQASRGHVFERTFSEPCIAEPCEGALKAPAGLAVDEASGDIYVVDKGVNRVARFNQAGEYLSELNGSGLLPGEETEAGAGGRPGESGGGDSQPGERGEATGRFSEPEGIAVDNSCTLHKPQLSGSECEAFDPSNGDVYVVDAGFGHRVIDKYDSSGKYLGQLTAAGATSFQFEPLDGVAVDPQGGVWVYRETPVIDGFSNAAQNVFSEAIATPRPARPGFAVDAQGAFYVRYVIEGGATRIAKLDHTGKILIAELDGENSTDVAVDQGSGNSLIENLSSVGVFDPDGRELERLGAGQLSEGAGIGVNAGQGFLYVADAGAGDVAVFAPQLPGVPSVEAESLAEVTAESAELGGTINPRSEAGEASTEYRFQYGRCSSASTCSTSPYEASAPIPAGQLAPDFESHQVSVSIEGLTPSATYHFRLFAKNSHGESAPGSERTFTTQAAGGELVLPDNRGWELVSPPDKQGALIQQIEGVGVVQAAAGGGGLTYLANLPTEAAPAGYSNTVQMLSERGQASWSTRDLATPHAGATGFAVGTGPEMKFFDRELDTAAVQPFGAYLALSDEASESTAYLRELGPSCGEDCFHPLVTGRAGFANVPEGTRFGEAQECPTKKESLECGPRFRNASEDLGHVLLGAKAELTAGAGEDQRYEWFGGALAHVSVLPDKAPASVGGGGQMPSREISADGSRVVFATSQSLYLRANATAPQSASGACDEAGRACTLQLDAGEAGCGSCESGGGRFQSASGDASRIFFSDTKALTEDAGTKNVEADLYECRILTEGETLRCELSDLTPKRGGEGAGVQGVPLNQGAVLGASDDGAYVYFAAKGVLSEAPNARGQRASAGEPNLYLRHGASTNFIATLARGDSHDWKEQPVTQPTRVSPNGRFLELMSEAALTGYDNRDVTTGEPVAEVYIYDAATNRLSCASCEPTGARPAGVEYHRIETVVGGLAGDDGLWEPTALVAANVPGWTAISLQQARHQPRYLTDSGRLFFNSADALVPQDANRTEDVYEYEPAGVGGCSESADTFSAAAGGCVALISSGSSAQESAFLDASESGDDVFFLTSAKLSPLDRDAARDVYDAHVCGEASPCITFPDVQSPPCTTEASCKASPTPQPSIFGAPASATFSGPGNLAPPPPKKKTAEEIRKERLAKALKACHARKNKHKRKACEKAARKRYAKPAAKGTKKAKSKHKRKR